MVAPAPAAAISPPSERASGEHEHMTIPDRRELAARIAALPAGAPLVRALKDLDAVYVVGGAVRDLLLGGAPTELDLVVEGEIEPVTARLGGRLRSCERFGTATVAVDGFCYDVARARRERYPHPGALPEVEPASLDEDLLRRDFTVNAIAVAVGGTRAGELRAAPGALADLSARRLRVLHDRSFLDDPTRLLRLARYRARLRFEIASETRALAERALEAGALATVSGPRIGAELRLIAREQDPVAALEALSELGLDTAVDARFGLRDSALARRALALLPAGARRDRLALAAAAHAIPRDQLEALLDRLAFEAADREAIAAAAADSGRRARALAAARTPSEVWRAVGEAPPEAVALAGALGPAAAAADWLERLSRVRLEIDGHDLIEAGVPEGPAVGRALRAALAAKLDGRAAGRRAELEVALAAARGEEPR
jgi:tRNA nucleotidyltransferase (CCA-adding enzyme)